MKLHYGSFWTYFRVLAGQFDAAQSNSYLTCVTDLRLRSLSLKCVRCFVERRLVLRDKDFKLSVIRVDVYWETNVVYVLYGHHDWSM